MTSYFLFLSVHCHNTVNIYLTWYKNCELLNWKTTLKQSLLCIWCCQKAISHSIKYWYISSSYLRVNIISTAFWSFTYVPFYPYYSFFPLLFYTFYLFLSYFVCLLFVCSCPTMSFISFFFPIPFFILFPVLFCFSYSFLSYLIISVFSPILS